MATYKIKATLTVRGKNIRSRSNATDELQVMLGCYDDMNDEDSSVCIHIEDVRREKPDND